MKVMTWVSVASQLALTLLIASGVISAATVAVDLSRYRGFQFGTDLPAVARQTGVSAAEAKMIYSRPALIQELEWRPQSLGASIQRESANDVLFRFYNGELYQVVIKYDRYEIEGMTAEDITEAVSAMYGHATKPAIPVKPAEELYNLDQDEVVARWQDPEYGFDLVRSSYGPSFRLVGVQKKLDSLAQAAMVEGKRLDVLDAPQRDAARQASEQEAALAKLEKARVANKPRFRP